MEQQAEGCPRWLLAPDHRRSAEFAPGLVLSLAQARAQVLRAQVLRAQVLPTPPEPLLRALFAEPLRARQKQKEPLRASQVSWMALAPGR